MSFKALVAEPSCDRRATVPTEHETRINDNRQFPVQRNRVYKKRLAPIRDASPRESTEFPLAGNFPDHTESSGTAGVGSAVEIAMLVKYHSANWYGAVIARVNSAKVVK
jgi:hypothetical protein